MPEDYNSNAKQSDKQTLAEERIKLMFEATPMSCIYLDKDAKVIDCNTEAVRIFGINNKQEYIERFHEFIPPLQPCGTPSIDVMLDVMRKAKQDGSVSLEWMHVVPSGPLPCHVTVVSAEHQGEQIYISYGRDLREEKKMLKIIEEERARSETLALKQAQAEEAQKWFDALTTVLNALDTLIYVTDQNNYEILFVNDKMKSHITYQGDATGHLCYELFYGNDRPCSFCTRNQLREELDKVIVWEEHNQQINRDYRNYDRNIVWPDGRIVHLQHSVDITDLRAAERRAEQSSKAKSIFLTSMSHEIRTPMNAILGITEMQMQNLSLSPETEEAFGIIYDSGSLLMNIINDVLDLSKIEAGKLEIVPVKYDIPSLIYDTVQLNRMRYESKPLEFTLIVDENTPLNIFGDELRIKQVLNNILSNAFKYTDAGEVKLAVSAEVGEDMDIVLIFEVSDTGQGMTEEQLNRLYEDYTRFNMQTNRTVVGTGLGMSITKHLVEMMDGMILAESTPGSGSHFTVRLPQKRLDKAVCGTDVAECMGHFRYQRSRQKTQINREYMPYGNVLVVDDVESNIYVARGMLLPYGLNIDTANNGYEAIDYIKSGRTYDIIFMDHMMPHLDGIEVTKILHDLGYTRPIVALTANAIAGRKEMFLANGFDDYISKPIDSRDLNAILNKLIRDKQPQDVLAAARRGANNKAIISSAPNFYEESLKEPDKSEAMKAFVINIEKSTLVLEEILKKLQEQDATGLELFKDTIQGLKNILAQIGESQLAEAAGRLEKAGSDGNIEFIISEAPAFLKVLQLIAIRM
ncbi:MAG: ATP-binding protein [Lachnospiraceae bacterium]|nr:ATP-binding protein [Lachnospiraceae bacterium]